MAKSTRRDKFSVKVTRSAAAESGEGSPLIKQQLADLTETSEKGIAMLSKEVQDLVDRSRKANDMIKSVEAGMEALRAQNEQMKAKIEEIANQPPKEPADTGPAPVGQPAEPVVYSLSDEDKAALLEVTKGFDDAIESLKDDIPANVEPPKAEEPAPAPDAPAPTEEKQPEVADPVGHAQDAEAASQAKPLDGTGAPAPEEKQDPSA